MKSGDYWSPKYHVKHLFEHTNYIVIDDEQKLLVDTLKKLKAQPRTNISYKYKNNRSSAIEYLPKDSQVRNLCKKSKMQKANK